MNLAKILRHTTAVAAAIVAVSGMSVSVSAQSQGPSEALVVTLRDGSVDNYFLADYPQVTFSGQQCNIKSDNLSATYPMGDVEKAEVKLVATSAASDIERPGGLTVDLSDPTRVTVAGLEAGSTVSLISITGIVYSTVNADGTGTATLQLENLAAGVYIIHTNTNRSIKIHKR